MEIGTTNELIAVFMGVPSQDQSNGGGFMLYENPIHGEYEEAYALDYECDWNYLMPVLKEIEDINFELPEDSNLIGDITEGLTSIDIRMTYEAVIKFINYYNENK